MERWLPEELKLIHELRKAVAEYDEQAWTLFDTLESGIAGAPASGFWGEPLSDPL
jgi:hypothetical protein